MTEEVNLTLKICFLGDSAVGKTSLISKYAYDVFNDNYITTSHPKATKKNISIEVPGHDKKFNITFTIHDIMGNVNLRGMEHRSLLCGASGAFLVCDVTRPETLENLIFWADSLYRECEENIPVIYMANKSDLTGGHMFDMADIEELKEAFNAPWLLTSARTGDNVEEAFRILGTRIIDNHLHKAESHLLKEAKASI